MFKCILFDLDDTLLMNDMETFAPPYYAALSTWMKPLIEPGLFMRALAAGISAMWNNDGSLGNNANVFNRIFFDQVGGNQRQILDAFDSFYSTEFLNLQRYTGCDPAARQVMEWVRTNDIRVVIATQPVFPLPANLARLRWADVPADEFDYELITSYDLMRASKPHRMYFEDILTSLHLTPQDCCMVGDSLETDIPARIYGFSTFWVQRNRNTPAQHVETDGKGSLEDLLIWLQDRGD